MALSKLHWPSIDLRTIPRRLARSKLVWSAAVLLLVYTLGGFLLAPYLVKRYVPSLAEAHLGRPAAVENVRINPFALTFEATRFTLNGDGNKALLAFERLFVDFDLSSLFDRTWTFAEIRLERPTLALEIDRNGRLNLLDLIERLRKPPRPDTPPPRLIVHHILLDDGRVSFTDLSGPSPESTAVTPVDLELWNFGTLRDQEGRYRLDGKLPGGGTLAWKGDLSLQPIASSGEISLQGMKLETAWRFMRDVLNVQSPRGELAIAGHYDFGYRDGKAALDVKGVQATLSGLFLGLAGEKEPLVALGAVRVSDASFTLEKRELVIANLSVTEGGVNAAIAEDGVLDWQRMTPADKPEQAPRATATAAAAAAQPWQIRVRTIALNKIALGYADRSRKPALTVSTGPLTGRLALDVTAGARPARIAARDIELELAALAVTTAGRKTPPVALDAFTLSGGHFDSSERTFSADSVALRGGGVRIVRGRDGGIGLLGTTPDGEPEPEPAPQPVASPAAPAAQPWQIRLREIALEKIAFAYGDRSRTPTLVVRTDALNGRLGLDVTAGAAPARIVAGDIDLEIAAPTLTSRRRDTPLLALEAFVLSGGRLDTAERTLSAKSVALRGGGVRIERGQDGAIGLLDALAPKPAQQPAAAPAQTAQASDAWRYRIETLALERFALGLADHGFKPAIGYDVEVTSISARNIDSASKKPIAFSAALRTAGGTAKGEGTLQQDFGGARTRLTLARIPLEPLRPLIARHAALELKSGNLSGDARVSWRRDAKPSLRARGELRVDELLVNEEQTNARFVAWKSAVAEDIALTLSPDKLAVRLVRVVEPGAKIAIARDRTMNVTQALRRDPDPQRAAPKPAGQAAVEPPPFPYDIGAIRLEKGTLDFSDASLVLPFATQVQALQGSVVGISSDPQARAELRLSGQVDQYGEARASGTLIPRDPEAFLDIRARFENIDMPLLSPYSATFAGRKVASGKLSLILDYKIVKGQLAGENRVVLRDFTLGERVKAPNALDLPLDLAVALLKDSEGKIDLAVPVRGNMDNPEFDYGKVIRAAIANAITRVVTAPFRALASLFKGDVEEVRTVRFAPGSDRIAPAQREQLDTLAKALKERPQLTLVVKGPYDPQRDARQLRRRAARLDLARALDPKLAPDETPGPIAYGRADTQRALEALLAKRAGPDAMAVLEKEYAKRTGKTPDRVNPVLGRFGRGSKDTEFYEAVFDRLVEAEPLAEGAGESLAERRARAIIDTLAKAGVDPARIRSGGITEVKAGDGTGITTELALAARP
ncbi:MAG TPA: DUF748 domain-containing protein [Burkholderiales bacterium]|nr:DUF748 domain-containing protein [Burkholderiales bacterium]